MSSAPPAPWTAIDKTDPTTGKKAMAAYANAKDGSARMTVRCDTAVEPVVSIQVRTRMPLDAAEDHPVAVKFDGADPITANWEFPGKAMLTSNPATVTSLISGLVKAQTVSITSGTGPSMVTTVFDGPSSPDGIKAVLAACGYEIGVVPPPPAKGK
jgi:hypothetical protein